jgi:hypothetical protein
MNSNAIETHAINAVKDSIITVDFLDQFISEKDKEPSWDGFIYLYKSKDHNKENFTGRVPVQIKGEINSAFSSGQISYVVEMADLYSYQKDRGVVYFVVYINKENPIQRKIYYEALTPVKIASYIKGSEDQKTKTIKLKEFPSDSYKKTTILLNFFNASKKQASFPPGTFLPIEKLQNNDSYKYTMFVDGYAPDNDINSFFQAFFENDIYVYVSLQGSETLIPVDVVANPIEVIETVNDNVSVNNRIYYKSFERIRALGKTTIKIGNILSIVLNHDDSAISANISLRTKTLREEVVNLSFLIDAIKAKKIQLGNVNLNFLLPEEEQKVFDLIKQEERLKYYNQIIELLSVLHVEEDIELDKLSDRHIKDIDTLIMAILDKKIIKNIKANETPTTIALDIANISLKLIVVKDKKNDGYIIQDFFNSNIYATIERDDTRYITSIYSTMQVKDYVDLSNIDYDSILYSFKNLVKVNEHIYDYANQNLLTMLLAFDEKSNQKLFEVAESIAKWIYEENAINNEIALLNYFQVIKRKRSLKREEVAKLYELTENNDLSEDVKVGAYLLLENQIAAEMHFEKMSTEQQDSFKTFPIYKFWQKV